MPPAPPPLPVSLKTAPIKIGSAVLFHTLHTYRSVQTNFRDPAIQNQYIKSASHCHLIFVFPALSRPCIARRGSRFVNAVRSLFLREYDTIHALNHISFTINDGEMVGYIDPNGAGKSSTIKILSGILSPDSGLCLVNGRVPWKERKEHVRQIGVGKLLFLFH